MPSALLNIQTDDAVPLGDSGYFLPAAELAAEKQLYNAAKELASRASMWVFDPAWLADARAYFLQHKTGRLEPGEGEEQAKIVFDALAQPHRLSLVGGPPGAAKTTAATLWLGLALQSYPDIPVVTVALERTALHRLNDKMPSAAKNILGLTLTEVLQGKKQWPQGACVIVDEAGLLGTRDLATLLQHAADAQAERVFLIGDDKQSLPEKPGQPFRWLRASGMAHDVQLKNPFRQKSPELRRAVQQIYGGDVAAALDILSPRFIATHDLMASLRMGVQDSAPEKTMVIAHADAAVVSHWPQRLGGFRVLGLSAAQGLAVDRVLFVIGKKLNRSDLLVGCSRQRFALEILVDADIYPDLDALTADLADWPSAPMGLDVVAPEMLLAA